MDQNTTVPGLVEEDLPATRKKRGYARTGEGQIWESPFPPWLMRALEHDSALRLRLLEIAEADEETRKQNPDRET